MPRANWRETELGETCAVGCFPLSASLYGCHDLSGNTWDWTRSLYGYSASSLKAAQLDYPYPYRVGDAQREWLDASTSITRVLRGGSWFDSHSRARCAIRYRVDPGSGNLSSGVRIVVSPHEAEGFPVSSSSDSER